MNQNIQNQKLNGITIAGTTLLDTVKNIDVYPKPGMLVQIQDIKKSVGGCVPNVGINLAKIDPSLSIDSIAKIGEDENGDFILKQLQEQGIKTDKILRSPTEPTGFCDVMSVPGGERTFFLKKGANSKLRPDEISVNALTCRFFHIGYIFLLDQFDKENEIYGTEMAKFLKKVQSVGIKTSIDMVSDSSGHYGKKVIPSLKYCDYVIINEIECCGIWNIQPYNKDGMLNVENIKLSMEKCINAGVREKVIVHCKDACFILSKNGEFVQVPSLKIPPLEIKGTVGAGDAFCAACLYGLYNNYNDRKILEFASAAAACSLFEANATDGMVCKDEIFKIAQKYTRL